MNVKDHALNCFSSLYRPIFVLETDGASDEAPRSPSTLKAAIHFSNYSNWTHTFMARMHLVSLLLILLKGKYMVHFLTLYLQ